MDRPQRLRRRVLPVAALAGALLPSVVQPAVPEAAGALRPSSPYGAVEIVAGNDDFGDGGPATEARFVGIGGLAIDPKSNVYLSDPGGNRVRRIDARTGKITTVAGTGLMLGAGESEVATEQPLQGPSPLALDAEGRHLYIGEVLGRQVHRLDLATGTMEPLASPPGGFGRPDGLAWTPAGLLVVDSPRGQIWRWEEKGRWTALLPEAARLFGGIRTVTQDPQGRIYIAEYFTHRVLRWSPAERELRVVVGTGEPGREEDGAPADRSPVRTPDGLAIDPEGNLLVVDKGNYRICRVDATGRLTTLAESASQGDSSHWTPGPLAVDAQGNLWVGDIHRNRLLRFAAGETSPVVVAGDGGIGDGGPALAARLAHPGNVVADRNGDLYVSDTLHHRVRRIDAETGRIHTLAGAGAPGYNGDGIDARQARLSYPAELVLDGRGGLYVGDYYNNRVRRIDLESRLISTVAGTGRAGEQGDGGPAREAQLVNPHALLLERGKSLIVASAVSSKLRRIDLTTGRISAVPLGQELSENLVFYGITRWNGGLALALPRPGAIWYVKNGRTWELFDRSEVFFPQDVAVSPQGELYICETGRNRVLRWTGEELEVVVENLGRPRAISFDLKGNLLIAETFHNRVVRVLLAPPEPGTVEARAGARSGAGGTAREPGATPSASR